MIDLIVQEGDYSLFERSMKFILEENDKGLLDHDSIARARKFYDAVLKRTAETGNLYLFFELKNFGVIDGVNKEKPRLAISFLPFQVDEIIDHLKQSQKESQTYDDLEKNPVYKFLWACFQIRNKYLESLDLGISRVWLDTPNKRIKHRRLVSFTQ